MSEQQKPVPETSPETNPETTSTTPVDQGLEAEVVFTASQQAKVDDEQISEQQRRPMRDCMETKQVKRREHRDRGKTDRARGVGQAIAERAKEKGINTVVFDRGGYMYHGRVKALADAARAAGLEF